jgi:replicative DNA helicase
VTVAEYVEPFDGDDQPSWEDENWHRSQLDEVLPVRIARSQLVDGRSFLEELGATVPALWGSDEDVLWSKGEGLMLVGPDGVGKTSVAQQLVLCRIGVRDRLLGMPVAPAQGRVLYIAADRPRQAARSLRRMIAPLDDDLLHERLRVWKGPLPHDLDKNWRPLVEIAREAEATDIVIDSLKDVAGDVSKPEVGQAVGQAFQAIVAAELELVVLHHQRKEQQGGSKPKRLSDVYGSRWLTASMGSVAVLWGEPGDPVVEFVHLKQPVGEVGPFKVLHDHSRGFSTVHEQIDLLEVMDASPNGLAVRDAASLLFETDSPSASQTEKARRRLEALVKKDHATSDKDVTGVVRYSRVRKRERA